MYRETISHTLRRICKRERFRPRLTRPPALSPTALQKHPTALSPTALSPTALAISTVYSAVGAYEGEAAGGRKLFVCVVHLLHALRVLRIAVAGCEGDGLGVRVEGCEARG